MPDQEKAPVDHIAIARAYAEKVLRHHYEGLMFKYPTETAREEVIAEAVKVAKEQGGGWPSFRRAMDVPLYAFIRENRGLQQPETESSKTLDKKTKDFPYDVSLGERVRVGLAEANLMTLADIDGFLERGGDLQSLSGIGAKGEEKILNALAQAKEKMEQDHGSPGEEEKDGDAEQDTGDAPVQRSGDGE